MSGANGKVISFMNMKGGVCKTTLCANIANTLATHFKKKVLVIDMDPQFNATQYILGITNDEYMDYYKKIKDEKKTIYYLFNDSKDDKNDKEDKKKVGLLFNAKATKEKYLENDYIINVKENFDMIVGDIDLIELQISQKQGIIKRLEKYIDIRKLRDYYEYILIDCPPTYSFFFISAYYATDTYVIPVKPDSVSALGLSLLERAIGSIEDKTKNATSIGVIYTLIDKRNKIHEPIMKDIEDSIGKANVFKEKVYSFADIAKGITNRKFMLDIDNNGIDNNIKKIVEEFIGRVKKSNEQ